MKELRFLFQSVFKTFVAGLTFLLPLVILSVIFIKVVSYMVGIIRPTITWVNSLFGNEESSRWVGIFLVILIFFFGGLLIRIRVLKRLIGKLEDNVFGLFPGYRLVKSLARTQELSEDSLFKPALFKDGGDWQPCFLVEANKELSTIYIPEAPNVDAGDIKIVHSANVILLPITNLQMTVIIRDYGLGIHRWLTTNLE